jgi:hypothetical protein
VAAAEGLSSEAKLIAQTTLDGDGDEPPLEVSRRAGERARRGACRGPSRGARTTPSREATGR